VTEPIPVTVADWRDFLRDFRENYLALGSPAEQRGISAGQRDRRWLGFGPASEDEVRAAE